MTFNVIPAATLGGVNFLITSLLGFLRTEPERRWRNAHEYEKVVDYIDRTIEFIWYSRGNKLVAGELLNFIEVALDKHQTAKENVATNRSGDFARIMQDRMNHSPVDHSPQIKVENGSKNEGAKKEAGALV
ncbi:hypothetical protein N7494_000729 [Penicillium frequentans]|uniref:Uncharacterized protein n=1 Tax=Penicillium frequentans TaxID=3151616 RepID=A0AAD6D6R7_9EURO|nr:hypothetical protein N7494_000729 [Penicillium glabrum]